MDIIENLNKRFRIDAYEAAATNEGISSLESFSSIPVPDDYKAFIRTITEAEILIGEWQHVRIWGPLGCIEMNEAYSIQKYIPNSLAVGDDEGGLMLVFLAGRNGFGLYTPITSQPENRPGL
jgi:hypothetical protein